MLRARQSLRSLVALGLLAAVVALTGCTPFSNFDRRFGSHQPVRAYSPQLAGSWSGYWKSTSSGHTGCLEAIICQEGPCTYSARFHATFFKVLQVEYRIPLKAWCDGCVVRFEGQRFLLAGGMYRCSGYATATCFSACYDSPLDKGVFVMNRRAGNSRVCCPETACEPATPPEYPLPADAPAVPTR